MELRLATCTLRPWRIDDAAGIARHANNRNVSRNLRDLFPFPYAEQDARDWLATHVGEEPPRNLAIEVAGEVVGSVGLRLQQDIYRRTAEIGYWLAEDYWGRGIMAEVVRAVTDYGISTFGLARVEADVFARNAASARVLEKAGYVLEGRLRSRVIKDGEILDALLYAFVVEG